MTTYNGSCHCGAVKFRIDAVFTEATTCDCSLCVKRNAVMVCRHCGIYVFHRKRSAPDHFDVNSVPVRATEGASMSVV